MDPYDTRHVDTVDDARIVVADTKTIGDARFSMSLPTVEFLSDVDRTRPILTEALEAHVRRAATH
jgi:hypothetical protein